MANPRQWFKSFIALRGGSVTYLLSRLAIDIVMVNIAFFLGFVSWMIFYWVIHGEIKSDELIPFVREHYLNNIAIFNIVSTATFILSGLYVRLPTYRLRTRLFAVLRAVGLAFVVHTALMYILFRQHTLVPRASTLFGFIFALILVGLPRIAKSIFFRHYTIMPKRGSVERPVEHVLVVGGAGYIGSVLVRLLLQKGKRVRVLDNLMYGDASIRGLEREGNFELMVGDFRDVEMVVRAVRGVDAVIHLGAIVGDPACSVDDEITLEVNYAATGLLCEICRGAGIKRFIFASTCSVYGASDGILDENSPLNPVSLYATSKIDSEKAILRLSDQDFRPTILRLATAFGFSYRPRFDLVVNLLAAQSVTKHKIKIINGNQWRPFIHIYDISRAMIMCLEAPLDMVGGEVFNVGDDHLNCTLNELGEKVAKVVPNTEIEYVHNSSDLRNYRVSFRKIRERLGFVCEVSLEDGIREVADAVSSNAVGDYTNPIYSNVAFFRAHEGILRRTEIDNHLEATQAFLKKRFEALTGIGRQTR